MKDIIEKIAGKVMDIKLKLIRATVTEVRHGSYVCDVEPIDGDAKLLDVKLRVNENNIESGVVAFPKVGTVALVLVSNEVDAYLVYAQDIERVIIKQAGFRCEIDAEGNVVLNDGANEGLVKLPVLQTEIAKLNAYLNTIKQTFSSFVPVAGDGGAALKTAMVSALASQQTADLSEAGNHKIKH